MYIFTQENERDLRYMKGAGTVPFRVLDARSKHARPGFALHSGRTDQAGKALRNAHSRWAQIKAAAAQAQTLKRHQ